MFKNSKNPVITIGIPAHNGEEYIARAIESVIKQKYLNIEILISDDLSTDGTYRICKNYANKDNRIRLIKQNKNIGAIGNYIYLFNNASKDSVFFKWLDQDDFLVEDVYIETLVNKLFNGYDYITSEVSVRNSCELNNEHTLDNTMSIFGECESRYDYAHASLYESPMLFYSVFNISSIKGYMKIYFKDDGRLTFSEGVFNHVIASSLKGGYEPNVKFIYSIHGNNACMTQSINKLIQDYVKYLVQSINFFIFKSNFTIIHKLKLLAIFIPKGLYYLCIRLIGSSIKQLYIKKDL